MAANRALVAVTRDEEWAYLGWRGGGVEHEIEVTGGLDHIEFAGGLPYGLSVVEFDLSWRRIGDDGCAVEARNVMERRPTQDEMNALLTNDPSALASLWSDVTSTWPPGEG